MTDLLTPTPPEALKVSFSRLNLFHRCPKQFWYRHVEQLHEPRSLYAGAGALFHRALELNSNLDDLPDVIEAKGAIGYTAEMTARAQEYVQAMREFRSDEGEVTELHREFEILFKWPDPEGSGLDIRFHGYVDRILRGDKGLILDDYKLGNVVPSDVAQLQVYAPLVERILGEPVSLLRDVYLRKGGAYKVKAFAPALSYDAVTDLMGDMAHMFYRVGFYPAWGALNDACRTCAFADRCNWAGMASTSSIDKRGRT